MKEQYSLEEIVETLAKFKEVMNYVRQNHSVWVTKLLRHIYI